MKRILLVGAAAMALAACAHKEPERPAAAPNPGPVVLHDNHDNPSLGVGVPNYPPAVHHHVTPHHAVPHHQMHKPPPVAHDETPPPASVPKHKQTWHEKAKSWAHEKFHRDSR